MLFISVVPPAKGGGMEIIMLISGLKQEEEDIDKSTAENEGFKYITQSSVNNIIEDNIERQVNEDNIEIQDRICYAEKKNCVNRNIPEEKKNVNIEKLLSEGNTIQIKPRGYSMYPMFVPDRDEALIKKADIDNIKRGDVVLYRRKGSILVLHRVYKKKNGMFYMVGDNQTQVEGPLKSEQVIGILTGFKRNGKYISTNSFFYKTTAWIWLLLRPVRRPFQLLAAWIKKRRKR